jgi:hypothetical protein
MTFPLDLFITPYQMPKYDPSGAKLLGDAGEMMQNERLQQQKMAQNESQYTRTHDLQTEEARGKNKYYEDLIDARKQATREKSDEQKDKRVSTLLDAFRRAKTPRDRDLIRQELTRLGYSVEEDDTQLPDTNAAPAPAVGPLDALAPTKAAPTGKPAPKVDPKFQAALGQEMQKDQDPFGLGEPAPDEGAAPAPMDWGALGIPGMASPEKPKRGGRFTVRDQKGNLAQTFDEPVEREKSRQAVSSVLTPLIGQASNPEEAAAARVAADAATNAIDAGFSMQEAAKFGTDIYHKEMGRYKTEKRPGAVGSGGAGGMSRQEQSRVGAASDDTLAVVKEVGTRHDVQGVHKSLSSASKMDDLLSTADKDGFSGGAALSAYMKDISGATVGKEEVERIVGGAGKMSELETKLNRYTNGGKLDDDLIRGLKRVSAATRQVMEQRLNTAGDAAYDYIMDAPGLTKGDERKQAATAARNLLIGKRHEAAGGSGGGDEGKKKAVDEARQLLKGLP